jgi:hypothetical protein
VRRTALALIALLVGLVGCSALSGPYREYEIRFEGGDQPVLGANPSDEELINATAWLIRHKLELPFPPTIKAYVYVNEATCAGTTWRGCTWSGAPGSSPTSWRT